MSTTTTALSRDPGDYRLSIHAGQRRRDRDVPYELIAEAIREGEVRDTHHPHTRLFVAGFDDRPHPLGVVANVETGEIATVTWRDGDE